MKIDQESIAVVDLFCSRENQRKTHTDEITVPFSLVPFTCWYYQCENVKLSVLSVEFTVPSETNVSSSNNHSCDSKPKSCCYDRKTYLDDSLIQLLSQRLYSNFHNVSVLEDNY